MQSISQTSMNSQTRLKSLAAFLRLIVQILSRAIRQLRPLSYKALNFRRYLERKSLARTLAVEELTNPLSVNRKQLEEVGFSEVTFKPELIEEILASCRAKFRESDPERGLSGKKFFRKVVTPRDFFDDPSLRKLILHEPMLQEISNYLGNVPFLEYAELLQSLPSTQLMQSQLWHRDRTAKRIVKVFLYIEEVEIQNGPFGFVSAQSSCAIPFWKNHYIGDDDFFRYVSKDEVQLVIGKPGKSFLIDTARCFHFGSRCQEPRLVLVLYFTDGFGFYPRETDWSFVLESKNATLSRLQSLALGIGE